MSMAEPAPPARPTTQPPEAPIAATGKPIEMLSRADSQRLEQRRRGRNWAILAVLAGVIVLFYAITIVKMHR